ncbi:hypothetical protein NLG97_g8001 [Lecanicillium saksenae]|uniref:Uncharacterized protein n=1 Tax=Lecanicillium saksenae TaxID=468837 RepID=A0ACC1QMK5_9HYPO|nr:hypothetical protein NLG97_g8001 [Lecanicillium saksenae]
MRPVYGHRAREHVLQKGSTRALAQRAIGTNSLMGIALVQVPEGPSMTLSMRLDVGTGSELRTERATNEVGVFNWSDASVRWTSPGSPRRRENKNVEDVAAGWAVGRRAVAAKVCRVAEADAAEPPPWYLPAAGWTPPPALD